LLQSLHFALWNHQNIRDPLSAYVPIANDLVDTTFAHSEAIGQLSDRVISFFAFQHRAHALILDARLVFVDRLWQVVIGRPARKPPGPRGTGHLPERETGFEPATPSLGS